MHSTEFSFEGIGTRWQILSAQPIADTLRTTVSQRVADFDQIYSRFRPDSLVAAVSRAAGRFEFPADAGPLIALYQRLYRLTDGAMTPLVGDSLAHLGYDQNYTLRPYSGFLQPPTWDEVMCWSDRVLTTTRPVTLDFGAAGKGLLVDILGQLLRVHGHDRHLIDGSGDLYVNGLGVQRIGLEHPNDPGLAIGIANVADGALCGSATNRRAWAEGLHHVLDGRSGKPTTGVLATWVQAETAMIADGLATGLFLASPETFAEFDFGYVRMFADGRAEMSGNFSGELFT